MAKSRKRHVQKNRSEIRHYLDYMKHQDNTGTTEERLSFGQTDDAEYQQSSTTQVAQETTATAKGRQPIAANKELEPTTTDEELNPTVQKERQPDVGETLLVHFSKHWLKYAITVIGTPILLLLSWIWNVQDGLSKIGVRVEYLKESGEKLDKKMENSDNRLHDLDKANQKNGLEISHFQKLLDRIATELEAIKKTINISPGPNDKQGMSKPSGERGTIVPKK